MHTHHALEVAERIRQVFTEKCTQHPALIHESITLSIGIAINQKNNERFDAIQARADKALYTAKETGKDKTILYNE
ncbi:diguanylate cyclase [Pseudoalteromonas sp. MMG012]|nr:diguanylate cyclase [Pseudoalteromonas sp. MMG012]